MGIGSSEREVEGVRGRKFERNSTSGVRGVGKPNGEVDRRGQKGSVLGLGKEGA